MALLRVELGETVARYGGWLGNGHRGHNKIMVSLHLLVVPAGNGSV